MVRNSTEDKDGVVSSGHERPVRSSKTGLAAISTSPPGPLGSVIPEPALSQDLWWSGNLGLRATAVWPGAVNSLNFHAKPGKMERGDPVGGVRF